MILCKVQGQVVATIKHASYVNRPLLVLDHVDSQGLETGGYLVAVDTIGARDGDTVLVVDEGNAARQILRDPAAPIRSVIVGIVDTVSNAES
jgi:ethanolamine utilization protein EutN